MGRKPGTLPIGENPGDRKKASRYRARLKGGKGTKPLTKEEKEWFEIYEARKVGIPKTDQAEDDDSDDGDVEPATDAPADPPPPSGPADPAPPVDPGIPDQVPDPIRVDPAPTPPTPPRTPTAPLPVPPRATRDRAKESAGGEWQAKYGGSGSAGREAACVYIGSLWHGGIKQMSDAIRDAGIDPVIDIDDAKFKGAVVLAVDDILPPEFELTPTIVAVGGSSAIMIQRFMRRDTIKKHQVEAAAKAKSGAWKASANAARDANEAAPPPPEPIPTPPPPPSQPGPPPPVPPAPPMATGSNGIKPKPQELALANNDWVRPVRND